LAFADQARQALRSAEKMGQALGGAVADGACVDAVDAGSRAMLEAMNKAIGFHGMLLVVDRVFAFNELREALT